MDDSLNAPDQVFFRLPVTPGIGGPPSSEALLRIVDTFAPSQPVLDPLNFTGRTRQLEQLICAIEEHRNHVLVYGPRGCGKTSLALTLLAKAQQASYTTIYLTCSSSSTFQSIFRSALRHIPRRYDLTADSLSDVMNTNFSDLLPAEGVTPQLVGELFSRISGTRVIIAIDEFELRSGLGIAAEVVELMKNISDHGAPAHLILIGAGTSWDDLLGHQDSIPRSLFRLKLEHMSDDELAAVITRLSKTADLDLTREALDELVVIAQGKLFAAKLIALRAAKSAALRKAEVIDMSDFDESVDDLCQHFNSRGFADVHNTLKNSASLQVIFQTIVRTIREVGDYFTVEQVLARCDAEAGSQRAAVQQVELVLKALTETRSVLVQSERNGTQVYHFADPSIELAIAILAYQSRSVQMPRWAQNRF
ncbi:MAG TPA: ATP-binding protein [Pseudolabrys sp.]|nr:ATP-binding protein [Pseudolabrys sp.]